VQAADPPVQEELDLQAEPLPKAEVVPEPGFAGGGSAWAGQGTFFSRYAGAMLLRAFSDRVGASEVLAGAVGACPAGGPARFDDVALLPATSMVFGLGAGSIEQVTHVTAAEAGPLCGLGRLPDRSTLRPRLAAIAQARDPLVLQRAFATAMLAADPCTSGVYFVGDHFVSVTTSSRTPARSRSPRGGTPNTMWHNEDGPTPGADRHVRKIDAGQQPQYRFRWLSSFWSRPQPCSFGGDPAGRDSDTVVGPSRPLPAKVRRQVMSASRSRSCASATKALSPRSGRVPLPLLRIIVWSESPAGR
jgi:hypothetical protein